MSRPQRQMSLAILIGGVGGHQGAWRRPNSRVEEVATLQLFADHAAWAERGKFDALFMADALALDPQRLVTVPYGYLEPITLLSALAARTECIGLMASVSTTFSEPYNVARQFASLDHISKGRAAWNIVTSAAGERNFGDQPLPAHADRYRRAEEYLTAVVGLWDSWADDAILADRATGRYADAARIRRTDFVGEYFQVEGPLNVPRAPQGRPVLVQAGSSDDGMNFAARHAEVVFSAQQTLESARDFYCDQKRRVAAARRDPGQVKILPGVSPIIAPTERQAQEMAQELRAGINVEMGLARLGKQLGGIDLASLDIDSPIPAALLPDVHAIQGRQGRFEVLKRLATDNRYTVRQLIEAEVGSSGHWVTVGDPEQIANRLDERFRAGAADGFVVIPAYTPEGIELIVEGVIPILQRRGLFRTDYAGTTLRDHLGLERPAGWRTPLVLAARRPLPLD